MLNPLHLTLKSFIVVNTIEANPGFSREYKKKFTVNIAEIHVMV